MLVSFSTQVARQKRKKGAFLVVPVTALEQAAAVVRAAETQRTGVALEINATEPLLYSLEMLVSFLLYLGRESSADVTVCVRTSSSHIAVQQALEAGAQLVIPEERGTQAQYLSVLSWSNGFAAARGSEIGACLPARDVPLTSFAEKTQTLHLACIDLPFALLQKKNSSILTQYKQVRRLLGHELMISVQHDHTPAQLRALKQAGSGAVRVLGEFDETFSAGVRAGLRSQSEGRPAWYLGRGGRAVEDKTIRYLETLC